MEITVYRCTGKHSLFSLPKKFCEECDAAIAVVKKVIEGKPDSKLTVKSWFDNLFQVLIKGGWHCPVVIVNGKLVSQGIIPSPNLFTESI